MPQCNRTSDPIDAALHQYGLCWCRPARSPDGPLGEDEARQLLALGGFTLHVGTEGYYAHDPARDLYSSYDNGQGRALASTVSTALGSTHRLAGPLTMVEVEAELKAIGWELCRELTRWSHHRWYAINQALGQHTGQWDFLKDVRGTVRRIQQHDRPPQLALASIAQQAPIPNLGQSRRRERSATSRPNPPSALRPSRVSAPKQEALFDDDPSNGAAGQFTKPITTGRSRSSNRRK